MRLVGEMLRRIALMPYQADINVKYKMSREKEDKHMDGFEFRDIRSGEADEAILIEQICFPPHEACSPKAMAERIAAAPEFFLVAIDKENGKMAGFFNGVATDEPSFRDEFFTDISLHHAAGKNVMLLGLDVLPEYRGRGLAREIVERYIKEQKERGGQRLILTCLDGKVEMYVKMGFTDRGIADSTWGNEVWHEMCYVMA